MESGWAFQMAPSMEKRQNAIYQLTPPSNHFDKSLGQNQPLLAFQSVLHDSGLHCIDVNVQHLTAQWNPSTIIACQRFLGRLKKATFTILGTRTGNANSTGALEPRSPPSKEVANSFIVAFSVNAEFGSICICLSEC